MYTFDLIEKRLCENIAAAIREGVDSNRNITTQMHISEIGVTQ
jgi:hypothetical protein